MSIAENIKAIEEKVTAAAVRSGRTRDDILVLAVSKTIEIPRIKEAVESGLIELGENKPQEIVRKYTELDNVKWHLIGHLQTNKVKSIIDKVCLIHSLDSMHLAVEIDKRAKAAGVIMDVLIEINIGNEEAKHGVDYNEAEALALEVSKLSNIRVMGLMCVAPFIEDKEKLRGYFRKMNKLFVDIRAKNYDNINMKYLSMGMTNDYETAIEEGANIVRIGTGIFGARDYGI